MNYLVSSLYIIILFISCQSGQTSADNALSTSNDIIKSEVDYSLKELYDSSLIELTEVDITLMADIGSRDISVFGVGLGMEKARVDAILSQNTHLYFYIDKGHSTEDHRIYVYDKDKNGEKNNALLYLIWPNGQKKLGKITVFEFADDYLVGNTKELITENAIDPKSEIMQTFLGNANDEKVTLEVPSISLKHITYYYSRGLEVTLKDFDGKKGVVFALILNKD